MPDELVDPDGIPTLSEVDFEELERKIRNIRSASGTLQRRGGQIDGSWAGSVGFHYQVPNGAVLAEKMLPVKENSATVAESAQTAADALQKYAHSGASIKKSLKNLKRDAEHLVAKAKPLGEEWRHKHDLVEENNRIKSGVKSKLSAHSEAQQTAADKINATNDGPGTHWAEQGREYLGFGGFVTTGLGAKVSWITRYKYGQFNPQSPNQSLWKNTAQRMQSKNWGPKACSRLKFNKWSRIGKLGARGSGVLTGVTSGLSQWSQDSQDKHMSTGKRVARSGTKAAAAGYGGYAGAQAGAAAGAAVGAAFGGVGAPIGAVVGGLAGAAAGSGIGSKFADGLNSLIGK